MTNGINWKRSLAGVLPLTLAACLSGNTQPQNTAIASGLSSPTLPSSKDIAYDDQDLVSLFTHASLRRHEGDYRGSNQALERAYHRSEELYTQRLSEFGSASLRKPGALPYRPNSLEVGFISYLKALNHFATDADRLPLQQREAAAVEMRRLDVLQGEARFLQDMGLDSDKNRDLAQMVVSLFAERTNTELSQGIVDLQSPWLYVVSGIVFEINQDLDSARISYQRALDALPEGDLSPPHSNVKVLAEEGGLRCMQQLGASDQAIQESAFAALAQDGAPTTNSWLIEHLGTLPTKAPLEMLLTADSIQQRLILRPMIRGTDAEKRQQKQQFAGLSLLYSSPYKDAIVVELGDNWSALESLGLTDTIGGGIRLFLDYFSEPQPHHAAKVIGENGALLQSVELADIAGDLKHYQTLTLKRRFEEALLREVSKSAGYKSMTGGIKLPFSLGGALATFTAGADLRQWQLLPAKIRITPLSADLAGRQLTITRGDHVNSLTVPADKRLISIDHY
ncbi:hypothetical protein [Spongiibacter marinus]|uniref:hypothetical protein n=1 Tax=Spongiibacter marinus TaxID=354246 RepID=UPI0035BE3CA1